MSGRARAGSKLDHILQNDKDMQGSGNASLAFKSVSRKELKKKQQEAQSTASTSSTSTIPQPNGSSTTPSAPGGIKFATPVNAVKYDANSNPEALGFLGLALIQNPQRVSSLMCYDTATQQQYIVVPITDNFSYVVQPNNYLTFWDLQGQQYACQTQTEEALQALILHLEINKFYFNQFKQITVPSNEEMNKIFTANLGHVDTTTQRVIKNNDMIRIKYTCHLLTQTQQTSPTETNLDAILGPIVLDSSKDGSDNTAKSLVLGQTNKDLEALHLGLDGSIKNIPRVIVAPASLCYGPKETTKIPPQSDLVFLCTIDKVKQGKEQASVVATPTPTVTITESQLSPPSSHLSEDIPIQQPILDSDRPNSSESVSLDDEESVRKQRLKQRMAKVAAGANAAPGLQVKLTASTPIVRPESAAENPSTGMEQQPVQSLSHLHQQSLPPQPTPMIAPQQQQYQQQPILQYAPSNMHLPQSMQQQQQSYYNTSPYQQQQHQLPPPTQPSNPNGPFFSPNTPQHQGHQLMFNSPNHLLSPGFNNINGINNNNSSHNSINGNTSTHFGTSQALLEHTSNRVEHLYVMLSNPISTPHANGVTLPTGTPEQDIKPENVAPISATHIIATFQHLINQVNLQNDFISDLKLKLAQSRAANTSNTTAQALGLLNSSNGPEEQEMIEQLQQQIITMQKAQRSKNKDYNDLLIKYNDLEFKLETGIASGNDRSPVVLQPNVVDSQEYKDLMEKFNSLKECSIKDGNEHDSVLAQLQQDNTQAHNTIGELVSQIGQLQLEVDRLQEEKSFQAQQILDLKQTTIVPPGVVELQEQPPLEPVIQIEEKIVEVEKIVHVDVTLEPLFVELQGQYQEALAQVAIVKDQVTSLQTQVSELNDLVSHGDDKYNELVTLRDAAIAQLDEVKGVKVELQIQLAQKGELLEERNVQLASLSAEFSVYKDLYTISNQDLDVIKQQVQEDTASQAKARQERIIAQAKNRLDDLTQQLEQQTLDHDEAMVKLAMQAKERVDKIKSMYNDLKQQYDNVNEQLVAKDEANGEVSGQFDQLNQAISSLQADLQSQKDQNDVTQEELDQVKFQWDRDRAHLQEALAQIETETQSLADQEVRCVELKEQLEEQQKVQQSQQNTIAQLQEHLADERVKSNDAFSKGDEAQEEHVNVLATELKQKQIQLEELTIQLSDKCDEVHSLTTETQSLQTSIQMKNQYIEKLTNQVKELECHLNYPPVGGPDPIQILQDQEATIAQLKARITELESIGSPSAIQEPLNIFHNNDHIPITIPEAEIIINHDDVIEAEGFVELENEEKDEEEMRDVTQSDDEKVVQGDGEQIVHGQNDAMTAEEDEISDPKVDGDALVAQDDMDEPRQPEEDTPALVDNQTQPYVSFSDVQSEPQEHANLNNSPKPSHKDISPFDLFRDDEDETLLSGSVSPPDATPPITTSSQPTIGVPKTVVPDFMKTSSLFGDDGDDDDGLFGGTSSSIKVTSGTGGNLFDDDLF